MTRLMKQKAVRVWVSEWVCKLLGSHDTLFLFFYDFYGVQAKQKGLSTLSDGYMGLSWYHFGLYSMLRCEHL